MISNTSNTVQLTLFATDLKNVAGRFRGTSDPYAIVTYLPGGYCSGSEGETLGVTETVKDDLNPIWTKFFNINYELGKLKVINVGIFDKMKDGETDKTMGSAAFEIGDMLGSKGNITAKRLRNGGVLFAKVRHVPRADGDLYIKLRGFNVKNVDRGFLRRGKSDPYFEISYLEDDSAGWTPVARSKKISHTLNPCWKPTEVALDRLCDNDRDKAIRITVLDHERSGKHQLIGSVEATVNTLLAAVTSANDAQKDIDMTLALELKDEAGSFAGSLVVTEAFVNGDTANSSTRPGEVNGNIMTEDAKINYESGEKQDSESIPSNQSSRSRRASFIEYISGGCEINMCVAIDFSSANGNPREEGTLHYATGDESFNDYESAIASVASIIAKYDSDNKFPVWGFGAKYNGEMQNCFQIGEEAVGVEGVISSYRDVFRTDLAMSGPSVMHKVIEVAASQAKKTHNIAAKEGGQAYTILLILTCGHIYEMEETKKALEAASLEPLSVVIVGIGNAEFHAMQFLDDLDVKPPARDITQFVEFQKHKNSKYSAAGATLEEIPDQLVDYFHGRGIPPLSARPQIISDVKPQEYDEEQDHDLEYDIAEDGTITLSH